MTHVNLDGLDETLRQFVLTLALDPAGSLLELNGRPVAWIVPAAGAPATGDEPFTGSVLAESSEMEVCVKRQGSH
jgi:hypothetical protein